MSHYETKTRVYITGMDRSGNGANKRTHLYDGDYGEPGLPMCKYGYNKWGGYSIWRGNISPRGLCKICTKRADLNLNGVTVRQINGPS